MVHSDTQVYERAVLVCEGQPRFSIVTPDDTTPVIDDAVHELNYWVRRITGVELDVVKLSEWNGQTRISLSAGVP